MKHIIFGEKSTLSFATQIDYRNDLNGFFHLRNEVGLFRLSEIVHDGKIIQQVIMENIYTHDFHIVNDSDVKCPELFLMSECNRQEIIDNGGDHESLYTEKSIQVIEC